MASYNKIILMGNLTRDPQMSYLPSQTPVCEFGMAMNRKFSKQDGSKGEEVCFVDCRVFGKSAETFNQYMSKGRQVLIEGRLQFDSWQDKDGNKRSKHRVFVENFQFLGGNDRKPSGAPQTPPASPEPVADGLPGDDPEDIPF